MFQYSNGAEIKIGDSVLLEAGRTPGIVELIVLTPEQMTSINVDEVGIMLTHHLRSATSPSQHGRCSKPRSCWCPVTNKASNVFKPNAKEVARIIHTPSRGGGLTWR